jgi:hypothetical protein
VPACVPGAATPAAPIEPERQLAWEALAAWASVARPFTPGLPAPGVGSRCTTYAQIPPGCPPRLPWGSVPAWCSTAPLSCGGGRSSPSPRPAERCWRSPPAKPKARANQEPESKPESESKEEYDLLWAPEPESKEEPDLLWAPEPESKGKSDLLNGPQTPEPESKEESDLLWTLESPSPRRSPISVGLT